MDEPFDDASSRVSGLPKCFSAVVVGGCGAVSSDMFAVESLGCDYTWRGCG